MPVTRNTIRTMTYLQLRELWSQHHIGVSPRPAYHTFEVVCAKSVQ